MKHSRTWTHQMQLEKAPIGRGARIASRTSCRVFDASEPPSSDSQGVPSVMVTWHEAGTIEH